MTAETPLAAARAASPPRSLYIHIPFCFHKCHYCDFYSFVDARDLQADFTAALERELRALADAARRDPDLQPPLETIFVGGGTPSLLAPQHWRSLLRTLHDAFDLAPLRDPGGEFTVECNPETVTPELMTILVESGVTRISVGAQSFNTAHLKTLERWHDPENVPRALERARDAGIRRLSIDLIHAIPGQTLDQWAADLDAALALAPALEHLSCYTLTYEPNTAMTQRLRKGEFIPADEDLEADMYDHTLAQLRNAGFDRYEVSNFSRPGAECRHNLVYWRQGQWLAAGPSASAHIAGARWKNIPRITEWMAGIAATRGHSPIIDYEPPDPRRALAERIMTGLRLAEGLDASAITEAARTLDAESSLTARIQRFIDLGLIESRADRWMLTDRGFLQADGIASEIITGL